MSAIFIEGCDGFTTGTQIAAAGWTVVGGVTANQTAGRYGAGAIEVAASTSTRSVERAFGYSATGMGYVQFHFNYSQTGTLPGNITFLRFGNNSPDVCLKLQLTPTLAIRVLDAADGVLYTSGDNLVTPATWNTVEVQAAIGSSSGTVNFWFNDTLLFTSATCDLTDGSSTGASWMRISAESTASVTKTFLIDDVIISDEGATPTRPIWQGRIGDKRIYTLLPTGDVGTPQWTPTGSGATNAARVDDALSADHDYDGTYVGSAVGGPGDGYEDLYTFEDLPAGVAGIIGVALMTEAKTPDADVGDLIGKIKLSVETTHELRTVPALTSSYRRDGGSAVAISDPLGDAWTKTRVDQLHAGYIHGP